MNTKFYIIYRLLVGLGVLLSSVGFGQNVTLKFDHITMEDGLSQSSVNCIMQDSYGFIWMGTQVGLNKYNGSNNMPFDYYLHNIYDTLSLSSNWIYSIDQDEDGNIWVGTVEGLNKIERKTGKIYRYLHDPKNPNSIAEEKVFGVLVDSKGIVWAKTSMTLNKLDPKTGKFTHYVPFYDYMTSEDLLFGTPIIEDSRGNILVGTKDGLDFFDREYEQFHRIHTKNSKLSSNYIYSLYEDDDGYIWIGTRNGLNRYNPDTREIINFMHDPDNPNSLSGNDVRAITQDKNGIFWIGTTNGLNRFNPDNNTFTSYLPDPMNPATISQKHIFSLCVDNSNVLWIGTYGGAINKVDLKRKKFGILNSHNFNLNYDDIGGIYIDDKGRYWIGTYGEGLNIIDQSNEIYLHLNTETKGKLNLINNYVHIIYKDIRGYLWLGTRAGLIIYLEDKDEFKTLDYIFGANNLTYRVNSIAEDKYHNLYVGTDRGLYCLNFETKMIESYLKNTENPESISENKVYSVVVDDEGFVWVGTDGGGLNQFNPLTGVFKHFKSNVNNSNTISNNSVFHLHTDKDGMLWIATRSGLNKYDKNSNSFTIYTKKDGLPSDLIYNIVEDDNGNLWLSTGYGLAMLDVKNNEIRSFDIADGLASLEMNFASFYKSKDGTLFFGGNKGINYFHPDSINDNTIKPNVVFLKYKKINSEGTSEYSLDGVNSIELNYNDYSFTIYFASLEYTNPGKNRYKFKIDELHDDWIELGTSNSRSFSSLSPGEYTFRVLGSNNDRVWSDESKVLSIIIKPPFWQTIYAYIAYFSIISFIVYYIFRLRTRRLRNANQALRMKQLAALEIAKQKEELSIKNKSIMDSINYAKRIQEAMMPSVFLFKKLFPQSFILYKPKDVVSGDFYWIAEKNNKIFVAAVDCTGHGVPGAFMSIIGFDLLRNITKEQGIEKPSQILNLLNSGVSETFSKHLNDEEVKDGMDASLCVIDKGNKQIEYSGAMNPLYIARDNKIIEIKGNRFSIGTIGITDENQEFENHVIPYEDNDMIYLFSDGYADQFGGPLGKKFKYRRFRHLLLTIHNLPLEQQRKFLEENIENWKGELEQVDDILVIGIKL
ncbi:MAG: hypothetical protein Kow0068_15410 [Marinilabiliales bacterium]